MKDDELLDPSPQKAAAAKPGAIPAKPAGINPPAAPTKPAPKMVSVTMDLGLSAAKITINGVEYHHGHTYTMREDSLPTLNEIMYNTKMHERVVKGEMSPIGPKYQGNGNRRY